METHAVIKKEIEEQAGRYFGNGFHCGEAVVKSVLDALGEDGETAAAHATPFGGGFGTSGQEACGALSGALIGIGHFYGRRQPAPEWDTAARLAAELHGTFSQIHGTVQCAALCEIFGDAEQKERCRALTSDMAGRLYEILIRESRRRE